MPHTEEAYCTLVTTDSYVVGAVVLAYALRQHGTTRPLAAIVTKGVSPAKVDELKVRSRQDVLTQQWYDEVVAVDTLTNAKPERLNLMNRADLAETFTKLQLWSQTQYARVVYLDADTLPLRAPDELFGLLDGDTVLAAAPELGFPDYFNSGLLALRPSADVFEQLAARAAEGQSFDGGDQGLLNTHFRPGTWTRLSFGYNVELNAVYRIYMPGFEHARDAQGGASPHGISVIHFIGRVKPWGVKVADLKDDGSAYSALYRQYIGAWWAAHDAAVAAGPPGAPASAELVESQSHEAGRSEVATTAAAAPDADVAVGAALRP